MDQRDLFDDYPDFDSELAECEALNDPLDVWDEDPFFEDDFDTSDLDDELARMEQEWLMQPDFDEDEGGHIRPMKRNSRSLSG